MTALSQDGDDLRLMAILAHPDDESSKGAATTAKYAAAGVQVLVVTMTGGERGDVLNPKLAHDRAVMENLAEVRRDEMAAAAAALGVQHRWMGFVDSGLPQGDPLPPLPDGCFAALDPVVAAEPLAALIRQFRPQVITTYDPDGGYPHPDHIQTHRVTLEAVYAAGDPDRTPPTEKPWVVAKVYYDRGFSPERILALHRAIEKAGLESPFGEWIDRADARPQRAAPITTRIDVGDFFNQRDAALRAHATQVDPDGFFFAIPRDLERSMWPWEEFELAHSTVAVDLPESDLFAGLR